MKKLKSLFADATAKMCLDCGGEPEPSDHDGNGNNEDNTPKRKRGRPPKERNLARRQHDTIQRSTRGNIGAMVSDYGASSASNRDDGAIEHSETSSFHGPVPNQTTTAVTTRGNGNKATQLVNSNDEDNEDNEDDDEPVQPPTKRTKPN